MVSKISKNIKKIRTGKNMTQDALAEQIHVTRQAISNWENDKTKPDIEALEKLAQVLEVEIEELIYGEKKENLALQNKTKHKILIKVILAVIGSLFVASGIAIVFFTFWKDFPITLQTAFSVLPMLMGQGFAIFTFFKKRESLSFRESASIIWIIGVVTTIALIDNIYDISWVYTDYLIIDAILITPVMFIFKSISPLPVFLYMTVHIASVGDITNSVIAIIIFSVAVLFTYITAKGKEVTKGIVAQWLTVIASLPLVIMLTVTAINKDIFADMVTVVILAFFLCMHIATPDKISFRLPYKAVSYIGVCAMMLGISAGEILDISSLSEDEILRFFITCLVCLVPLAAALIINRKEYFYNIRRILLTAIPFAMLLLDVANTLFDIDFIAFWLACALTVLYSGVLIYKGIKELSLILINLGIITAFIQFMSFFYHLGGDDILFIGLWFVGFGIAIIILNFKLLSIKKSHKEQESEQDA